MLLLASRKHFGVLMRAALRAKDLRLLVDKKLDRSQKCVLRKLAVSWAASKVWPAGREVIFIFYSALNNTLKSFLLQLCCFPV